MKTNPNDLAQPEISTNLRNENGYAFGNTHSRGGLTKREYFAAKILAAMLSNSSFELLSPNQYASDALIQADALIEELNK